jgi:hypothetical protein
MLLRMRTPYKVFAILFLFVLCNARASTNTSEITDMWWNPAESGWGINIILQNSVAFATFFVYDANHNPLWYTAELHYQGNFVWSGPLYATNGPWFGGPFPSGATTIRQVGTATFSVFALNQATLTYSVGDIAVTKTLQRQTWTNENYTGTYAGGYSIRLTGCAPSSLNGIQEVAGLLSVNQTGTSVSMAATTNGSSCSFSGTYTQTGKLGDVQGNYSCTDGTRGTFDAFEMTPTISGFTARIAGQNQYCNWSGYLGGISRAQ